MSSRKHHPVRSALILVFLLAGIVPAVSAQAGLTSPKQEFGFEVGADYHLINYARLSAYWKKLDGQSDRMSLVEIGRSSEGRPMIMAVITSPANHRRLARYKDISKRLALAEGLSETEARKLALEGRAVVWIDGSMHATEVSGAQSLIELVWRLVSRNDAETRRILDEVILLAVPANPDGMDLVADWYMREPDPKKRSTGGLPRLYQKYVGHDNNRDYYMVTQPETEVISRQLYIEWHPQFLYNQHQTGPQGTVLFCPPFRDPFNYYFDPLVAVGTDLLGLAMHERFLAEDKPGAIMRSGAGYSTWWNGGLRSTGYFHNVPGILTEIIGNPTPITIPFLPSRMLPKGDYPYPIMPQEWHFRSTVEYSVTASTAILDFAARRREEILVNRWLMGRNAIEKGNRDTWTFQPKAVAEIQAKAEAERGAAGAGQAPAAARMRGGAAASPKLYEALHDPAKRDPRGFILPADQPDFSTATKFVNTLIKSGVRVKRATKSFEVNGKTYPEGSYIVPTAQAFRPHLLSMFEPQDHPNDFAYPGGPPTPPYDSAGWTVAFQMGVVFDRILDGFSGPFEDIRGFAKLPAWTVPAGAAGFVVDHRINDAAILANRILGAGGELYWMKASVAAGGTTLPEGALYIPSNPKILPVLEKAGRELGLPLHPVAARPAGEAFKIRPVRIGVWDNYGGSMSSGWTQWVLDQFEFPWKAVYAPELDSGNLREKFDVLIFASGGIPGVAGMGRAGYGGASPANIPEEYKHMVGRVTVDKTVPQLKKFLDDGGTILTIGSSTGLAYHLGLPVRNHLAEKSPEGRDVPLPSQKFYVPGSILESRVDTRNPLAYGMNAVTDVFFDGSPVFKLDPEATLTGLRPVAWFEKPAALRSGWAWGESYLQGGVGVVEAPVGKGRLVLFGPEILFRGQPHGTFKLLFNGIHLANAEK
ncbi:MAG: peptidase [Candidatus Aminicenantes bacterium]|nr:peptidase [Candidatus Aminicenantes bacterium]